MPFSNLATELVARSTPGTSTAPSGGLGVFKERSRAGRVVARGLSDQFIFSDLVPDSHGFDQNSPGESSTGQTGYAAGTYRFSGPKTMRNLSSIIERPMCPACKHRMGLVRISPGERGFEERTFECGTCHRVEKASLPVDPMKTDALGWLASELRPPN